MQGMLTACTPWRTPRSRVAQPLKPIAKKRTAGVPALAVRLLCGERPSGSALVDNNSDAVAAQEMRAGVAPQRPGLDDANPGRRRGLDAVSATPVWDSSRVSGRARRAGIASGGEP
jgi:hypothetical protein